ncbi:Hypothetical predicted protein [Pelobates cultripes]|uniref:Uncharacterized protein n=1 Tax=Pelobates cultripes TaxID=61616 RepID=A0AAD1S142_PELCU|nr:Hypothetical predicted protein [Pelobates cultripes]
MGEGRTSPARSNTRGPRAEAAAPKRPHRKKDPAARYTCSLASIPATGQNSQDPRAPRAETAAAKQPLGKRRSSRQVLVPHASIPTAGKQHMGPPEMNSVVPELGGSEEAYVVRLLKPRQNKDKGGRNIKRGINIRGKQVQGNDRRTPNPSDNREINSDSLKTQTTNKILHRLRQHCMIGINPTRT